MRVSSQIVMFWCLTILVDFWHIFRFFFKINQYFAFFILSDPVFVLIHLLAKNAIRPSLKMWQRLDADMFFCLQLGVQI